MEHTNKRKRTISRAELAAIAATIIHGYFHKATGSLTYNPPNHKEILHPNSHYRHHIQGGALQSIAKAIHQSPSPIYFYKVKSHAGIIVIGNEHADALARKSTTTYSDVADTSPKTAGPEGNPFYSIYWLTKEYKEHQICSITYLKALVPIQLSRRHASTHATLHKLGNANSVANYHEYYQTLIKSGSAYRTASNAQPCRHPELILLT